MNLEPQYRAETINAILDTVIESTRSEDDERASAWHRHKKYDRTSRSKDVLINAKDKRIAKLEEENRQLRNELDVLRRLLYEKK